MLIKLDYYWKAIPIETLKQLLEQIPPGYWVHCSETTHELICLPHETHQALVYKRSVAYDGMIVVSISAETVEVRNASDQ